MPRPHARALTMACLCASVGCGVPSARAQDDFPKRRAGLWEIRSVGAQASGLPPMRACIGDDTDSPGNHLDRSVGTRGSCTLGAFRQAGSAWLAESTCREGRTVVTSRSIASGDFETGYRIDTLVSYDPPLGGVRHEDREALEATRLGPCSPGQKPGDMVVPGMGTLNMGDGAFRPEPFPRGRAAERPRTTR